MMRTTLLIAFFSVWLSACSEKAEVETPASTEAMTEDIQSAAEEMTEESAEDHDTALDEAEAAIQEAQTAIDAASSQ